MSSRNRCQADSYGQVCRADSAIEGEDKYGRNIQLCVKHWGKKNHTVTHSPLGDYCKTKSCNGDAFCSYLDRGIWVDICKYHMASEIGLKLVTKATRICKYCKRLEVMNASDVGRSCRYCSDNEYDPDKRCVSCNKQGVKKYHKFCRNCFSHGSRIQTFPINIPLNEISEKSGPKRDESLEKELYDYALPPTIEKSELPSLKELFSKAFASMKDVRVEKESVTDMIERLNPNNHGK